MKQGIITKTCAVAAALAMAYRWRLAAAAAALIPTRAMCIS